MSIRIMPQPLSKQETFALLMKCLDLIPSTNSDASPKQRIIFLSVDIEGTARKNGRCVKEVGVSILDTADLDLVAPESSKSIIKSHNFRTRAKYWYAKPSKPFLFGSPEDVPSAELKDLFQRITLGEQHPNPLYESEGIQVILLGHEIRCDMKIMEDCVPGIWDNTVISEVVDLTVLEGKLKLGSVLDQLGIGKNEYRGLHCGGNDANYSLRAILHVVVQHVEAIPERDYVDGERAELIERVVQGCVPSLPRGAPQMEHKRKPWNNVKDVEESLEDLGVGWCSLMFQPELSFEDDTKHVAEC